jgi:hypothetical protein
MDDVYLISGSSRATITSPASQLSPGTQRATRPGTHPPTLVPDERQSQPGLFPSASQFIDAAAPGSKDKLLATHGLRGVSFAGRAEAP